VDEQQETEITKHLCNKSSADDGIPPRTSNKKTPAAEPEKRNSLVEGSSEEASDGYSYIRNCCRNGI